MKAIKIIIEAIICSLFVVPMIVLLNYLPL